MTTRASRPRPVGTRTARLALAAAVALGAGCASTQTGTENAAGDPSASATADPAGRRSARLVARTSPPISGTAVLEPGDEPGQTVVSVSLQTSPSNAGVLAWRLVRGSCGVSSGTVVGSAAHYPVIRIEATGQGESRAVVPLPSQPGSLSVRVMASPTNSSLVACGDVR